MVVLCGLPGLGGLLVGYWYGRRGASALQSELDQHRVAEQQWRAFAANQDARLQASGGSARHTIERAEHEARGWKARSDELALDLQEQRGAAWQLQRQLAAANASAEAVASRYCKDTTESCVAQTTAGNLSTQRVRLERVFRFCEKQGFRVDERTLQMAERKLVEAFEKECRKQAAREEQRAIKEQMREEARAAREREAAIQQAQREEALVERRLREALSDVSRMHSAEVEGLRAKLAELEAKKRALSMAQLTKAGFVYVISNIGSFGEGVFKVGMTRRLEPMDRVKELGDASVPFPFDVHMLISCADAPGLEAALHRALHARRLNKANWRKEFFRASLEEIAKLVEANHGRVEYVATAEALEYNESRSIEASGTLRPFDASADGDVEEEAEFASAEA